MSRNIIVKNMPRPTVLVLICKASIGSILFSTTLYFFRTEKNMVVVSTLGVRGTPKTRLVCCKSSEKS